MGTQFHINNRDLQATPRDTPAKEVLIVRVLRPRDGMAGRAPKWECDFIDEPQSDSVLLAEAWGGNIQQAKERLKGNHVYRLTNCVIANKGKTIAFANNLWTLTINAHCVIEELPGEHLHIPLQLPIEDLAHVLDLKAARVVSLNLAIDTPAVSKKGELKRTRTTKDVANVIM